MLFRQQVFEILDKERKYQDNLWPPHEGQRHTEHTLVSLQVYLRKAEDAWIVSKDETAVWQQLAKMAAILIRSLEVGDETEKLLDGLR